jgi:hypothetical protein
MQNPRDDRPRSGWGMLFAADAPPRARMIAFFIVFVIVAVLGLILGAGPKSLALASIAGGLASIGVEWGWQLRASRRRR